MVHVLLFAVDEYDRWEDLEKKTDDERIELAKNDDWGTREITLEEFQQWCNDEMIDLNNWWIYFVNI